MDVATSDTRDADRDEDAAAAAAAAEFDFVRFTLSDLHGISRSKLIPRNHVGDALRTGISMGALFVAAGPRSQIIHDDAQLADIYMRSLTVRPLHDTLRPVPWFADGKYRVGEVLCETDWIPPYHVDGAPKAGCTRYVARNQLERLSALGYQLMSGFEAEFFMYRKDGGGDGRDVTTRPMFDGVDNLCNVIMAEHGELLCSMCDLLSAADIDVEAIHPESAPGQLEFATGCKFGIESADQMFRLKEAVKEIASGRGWQATFMTKPTSDGASSGMHLNLSLWTTAGQNAFYDPDAACRLSVVGRHWAAGLVRHASALTALLSPTVNCYRRLHQSFVPDRADCRLDDRSAMVRVVTSGPRSTYVENRLPSAAANPYLVLAATVAAGIDGLVNRLELPPEDRDGDKLPSSLSEALTALEADTVLCDALGQQLVRWFLLVKRQLEIDTVSRAKAEGREEMQAERELYFQFL